MVLPSLKYEVDLWNRGYASVAGLDEAGRGPLAGPLVAAAVIFPPNFHLTILTINDVTTPIKPQRRDALQCVSTTEIETRLGTKLPPTIRDSKTLSPRQRQIAASWIYNVALAIGVGRVENTEIDEIGTSKAGQLAFGRALSNLQGRFLVPQSQTSNSKGILPSSQFGTRFLAQTYCLVDAFTINDVAAEKQSAVIKGDQKVFSIAAASVIAKTTRDKIMKEYAKEFPEYGFERHKGYGTGYHIARLRDCGPCLIHRRSFHLTHSRK